MPRSQALRGDAPVAQPAAGVLRGGVERLRALDATIRELKAVLADEVEVQFEVAAGADLAAALADRDRRWSSSGCSSPAAPVVGLERSASSISGRRPASLGGVVAVVGLVLAVVALWLRRSVEIQAQLRDVEIDRRLRGRSEMEAELRQAEADTAAAARRARPGRPRRGRGPARPRGGARRPDRPAAAQLDGLVGKEPRDDAGRRCATRPRSRSSRRRARSRRSGRSPRSRVPASASRSRSATRRAALERARDDEANARARVEANAVDAEQVAGQAERLVGWRSSWPRSSGASASTTARSRRSTGPSRRR